MHSFNNMEEKLVILLVVITFSFVTYILYEKCNQTDFFTFEGIEKGPNLLIIGGTHGNEPSGHLALERLKNKIQSHEVTIQKGSLTMFPSVNPCGLKVGIRWNPGNILHPDINRSYPNSIGESGKCYISQKIIEMVDKADFVLDLHEGYDFYHKNPKSIGSTLSPGPTSYSEKISRDIKYSINNKISEGYKKFHIIKYNEKNVIDGTLSEYCRHKNKDYILIETTGQNNIQPLDIRVEQVEDMINVLLKNMNMIS